MKEIIEKLDVIIIKNFCSVKNNDEKMRRQDTDGKKILQKIHGIKDCYPKYIRNS